MTPLRCPVSRVAKSSLQLAHALMNSSSLSSVGSKVLDASYLSTADSGCLGGISHGVSEHQRVRVAELPCEHRPSHVRDFSLWGPDMARERFCTGQGGSLDALAPQHPAECGASSLQMSSRRHFRRHKNAGQTPTSNVFGLIAISTNWQIRI